MTEKDILFNRQTGTGFGEYLHRQAQSSVYTLPDTATPTDGYEGVDYDKLEYEKSKSKGMQLLGAGASAAGATLGVIGTFTGQPLIAGAGLAIGALGNNIYVKNTPGSPKGYNALDWTKDSMAHFLNTKDEMEISSILGDQLYNLNEDKEALMFQQDYVQKMLNAQAELESVKTDASFGNIQKAQSSKYEVDRLTPQYVQSINDMFGKKSNDVTRSETFLSQSPQKQLEYINSELIKLESREKNYLKQVEDRKQNIVGREKGTNWLFNHKVSDFYLQKDENTSFNPLDADSWFYKIPGTLGSSAISWDHQAVGYGGAFVAEMAKRSLLRGVAAAAGTATLLNPAAGIALTGLATLVDSMIRGRKEETYAELYENYNEKVRGYAERQGVDLKAITEAGKKQLSGTIDISKFSDEEILDLVIASSLPTGNQQFDEIRSNSRKGLDHLYNQNMALSAVDVGQAVVAFPFVGKLLSTTAKATGLNTLTEGTRKALSRTLDDVIEYGYEVAPRLKALATTPTTRAFGKNIGRDLIGATLLNSISEAYEEGNQYIGGKKFIENLYDGRSSNIMNGIWDNITSIYDASKAILGIGDSMFQDDDELFQNMLAGGMIGGLMTGATRISGGVSNFKSQLKANDFVKNLTAEQIKDKEDFAKAKIYSNDIISGRQEQVITALNELKQNLPEGLTAQDIDEEVVRVRRMMGIVDSPFIKDVSAALNIERGSDRFGSLVAMANYTIEKFNKEKANASNSEQAYNTLINSETFNTYISELTSNEKTKEAIKLATRFNTEVLAIDELIETLSQNKDKINEFNSRFNTNLNSTKIAEYIDKLERQRISMTEARVSLERYLKENEANFTLSDLEPYSSPYSGLMDPVLAYQNMVLSYISLGDAYEIASAFNGMYHPYLGSYYDKATGKVQERRPETPYYKLSKKNKEEVHGLIDDYLKRYEKVVETSSKMASSAAQTEAQEEEPVITTVKDGDETIVSAPVTQQEKQPEVPPTVEIEGKPIEITDETEQDESTLSDGWENDVMKLLKNAESVPFDEFVDEQTVEKYDQIAAEVLGENEIEETPDVPNIDEIIQPDVSDIVPETKVRESVSDEVIGKANEMEALSEMNSEDLNQLIENGNIPSSIHPTVGNISEYGKVSHTMFYDPTGVIGMFDGYKGGRDLGKLIADPQSHQYLTYKITVENWSGNFKPLDRNTWNSASIYLHITDNRDNSKYAAALREPGSARAWYARKNFPEAVIENDIANLTAFRNHIIETNNDAVNNGVELIPTKVNFTNGLFNTNYSENGRIINRRLSDIKGFEIPEDIYAIDNGTVKLGIGQGYKNDFNIFDSLGNVSDTPGKGRSGKVYIYPKNTPSGKSVNIKLNERKFQDDSEIVDLIFDLLVRKGNNEVDPVTVNFNGRQISTGFSPKTLLKYIVYNGVGTLLSEAEAQNAPFLVPKQLNFSFENQTVQLGNETFRRDALLSDETLANRFKETIQNTMHWSMDKNWLWDKVGHSLEDIHAFFKITKQDKLTIIPGKIEFTLQDVGLKREGVEIVEDWDHEGGISWIAWYIKNGILLSDLNDQLFKDPFVYIDDVTFERKDTPKAEQKSTGYNPSVRDLLMRAQTADLDEMGLGENKEPTDDIVDDDTFNEFLGIERPATYQNTVKKINPNKARTWLVDKLGIDEGSVTITNELITMAYSGTKAMGLTRDDSILLYEGAEVGTEYHEAFHRVNLLLHTPTERASVYERYKIENNAYDLSDKQIEERLAEGFREWMLSGVKRFKYRIQRFFNKILSFVGAVSKMSNTDISDLYAKIAAGEFSGIEVNQESVETFKQTYKQGAPFQMGSFTDPVEFKHIPTLYNYYKILNSLQTMLFFISGVRATNDISKLDMGKLKNYLSTRQNSNKFSVQQKKVLNEIAENFDKVFYPDLVLSLENLGIKTIERLQDDFTSQIEGGDIMSGETSWYDRVSFEVSKKDNALFTVKTFMAQMPETYFEYDENGRNPQNKARIDELTGLPLMIDFDTTWNMLLETMHNIENYSDIVERAGRLSKTVPFFATLYKKLTTENTNEQLRITNDLKTQLYGTLKSHKNNMFYISYGKKEGDDLVERTSFTVGDSNSLRATRLYPLIWSNAFRNRTNIVDKRLGLIKTDVLASIVDRYNTLRDNVKSTVGVKQMSPSELVNHKQTLIEILADIGINVDVDTLNVMMTNASNILGNDLYKAFDNLLSNTRSMSLNNFFNKTLDALVKGNPLTFKYRGKDKVKPLDRIFERETFATELAKAYAEIHPRPEEFQVLGAEGNLLYPISLNSYFSDQVRWLNEIPPANKHYNDTVQKLSEIPYNKRSIILRALKNRRKLELNTFVNFTEESSGDPGRGYLSISPIEDYLSKMTLVANDHMVFPTLADGRTYFTLSGINLYHDPIEISRENDKINIMLSNNTLNQLFMYAMDEFDAIKNYYSETHQQIIAENPNKRVKNYHTKNRGGRFRNFTGIWVESNGNLEYTDFNQLLDSYEKAGNVYDAIKIIDEQFFKQEPHFVTAAINESVKRRILTELEHATKMGIINTEVREGYRIPFIQNRLLDEQRLSDKANHYLKSSDTELNSNVQTYAIYDMFADYVVNEIISFTEFEKIFSKDPAYYKDEDDKIKRIKGMSSTGDNLRLDWDPTDDMHGVTSYSVAEIEDNMVSSQSYKNLVELFTNDYVIRMVEENDDPAMYDEYQSIARQKAEQELQGYTNNEINETDASVFISPRMHKYLLKMLGQYDEVADAFELLESSEDWLSDPKLYSKAARALIHPLKMTSFNDVFDTELKLDIPVYDKMALFPLFKAIATGDNKEIYNRMTAQGKYNNLIPIDMLKTESAVKVGSRAKGVMYTNKSKTKMADLSEWPLYTQEFKYLRRQLNTDPHTEDRQLLGTQVAKAALANIIPTRKYGNKLAGLPQRTGAELKREAMGAINALSNIGANNFLNSIGEVYDGQYTQDINKLSNIIYNNAKINGLSYDILEGVQVVDGRFKIPLSALSDSRWIESNLLSMVNKNTIDIHMPGGALIQMSFFGFKDVSKANSDLLNFRNPDGSMDAIVSLSMLKNIIPVKYQKDFTSMKQWLLNNNIIGKNSKPIAMGYRIPTQGLSSIVSLKITDVLPENIGDTIVLPSEFTKLTGSDFDIDKLYVARYNYEAIPTDPLSSEEVSKIETDFESFVNNLNYSPRAKRDVIRVQIDGYNEERAKKEYANLIDKYYDKGVWYNKKEEGVRRVPFFEEPTSEAVWYRRSNALRMQGFSEDYITKEYINWIANNKGKTKWELNSREANENRLLDIYMTVLTDDSNVNETRMPLDNINGYLKNVILKNVDGVVSNKNVEPYQYLSPSYQLAKKYEYTGGKMGIAPFALNSVHHVLTQLTNLTFKNHQLLKYFGLGRLDEIYSKDRTSTRILDWLSAMINAHVDVAKDPYVVRLNIVQWTYNMTNLLLRSGLGENTFYFMPQPILKEMAQRVADTQGRYGIQKGMSATQLENEAISEVYRKYQIQASALADTDEKRLLLENLGKSNKGKPLSGLRDTLWNTDWLLKQLDKGRKGINDFYYLYGQMKIYQTWEALSPYAKGLSELVHTSQIDTKKFGNNFMLQKSFLYRVSNNIVGNKVFEASKLKKFYGETFLDTKIRNSILLSRDIFKDHLVKASDQFLAYHNAVLALIGQLDTRSPRLINTVSNSLEAKIKSNFFNDYITKNNISVYKMLYGDDSIASRLIDLQSKIRTGAWPELLDPSGNIINEFLNYIEARPGNILYDGYQAPDFITTNALTTDDQYLKNKLKRYWGELLNSPIEEIRKFAEDLVVFAFITSGDNPSLNNIFNLVPLDYREKMGYTKYMQSVMDDLKYGILDMNLDDVFKNNWQNGLIVPDIPFTRKRYTWEGSYDDNLKSIWSRKPIPGTNQRYPLVIFNKRAYTPVGVNADNKQIFPPYVKYNMDDTKNPATTILYKYIGNYQFNSQLKPVYAAVHKKSINIDGIIVTEYDNYKNSGLAFNNLPDAEFNLNGSPEAIEKLLDAAHIEHVEDREQLRKSLVDIDYIEDFYIKDTAMEYSYDYIMNNTISEKLEESEELKYVNDFELSTEIIANNPKETVLHSGAAIGSDSVFEEEAIKRGLSVNAWSFEGHSANTKDNLRILTTEQLNEANEQLEIANKALNRKFPTSKEYVNNLLRRNYYQIKDSDAVYAIGELEIVRDYSKPLVENNLKTSSASYKQIVAGGTGWATQMAVDLGKPVFVFDQVRKQWFISDENGKLGWSEISVPKLTKSFAGIGTREINEAGVQAIKDLFSYTFDNIEPALNIAATPVTPTKDTTINVSGIEENTGQILFNSRTEGYEALSNFYNSTFTYDGTEYSTAEHAFQAAKIENPNNRFAFSKEFGMTPAQAKSAGRRVNLRSNWESIKDEVMHDILYAKFSQNEGLKQLLLDTKGMELIHDTSDRTVFRNNDTYWGNGFDGNGLNKMGRILMAVRNELTDSNTNVIQNTESKETYDIPFNNLRQVKLTMPALYAESFDGVYENFSVAETMALYKKLVDAERLDPNQGEGEFNVLDDFMVTEHMKNVYDRLSNREKTLLHYANMNEKSDTYINLSDGVRDYIIESGTFVQDNPNQLNLFDDFSDEAMNNCKS